MGLIEDSFKERKKDIELKRKSIIENLIVHLIEMDIFTCLENSHIRKICEKVVKGSAVNEDYSIQKIKVLKEAMELNEKLKSRDVKEQKVKTDDGLINIYELSKEKKIHTYELLKKKEFIKNHVDEFQIIN